MRGRLETELPSIGSGKRYFPVRIVKHVSLIREVGNDAKVSYSRNRCSEPTGANLDYLDIDDKCRHKKKRHQEQ